MRRRREGDDPRRDAIETVSAAVCDLLEPGHDAGSRAAARALVAPVLSVPAGAGARRLSLVGHAHLDTAWLWPVRETVRKAVRTYANVLSLMRDDEAMTFAGSQAAQHCWVRDRHPGLWADVVARAGEGRWVPVGGMWVEPDVLLPSGESLARQLVAGQRFFGEELGREARTGWLPDCFGYPPALPQLLRAAGIDAFVTQKLSWNDTNRFPHTTFWWEGLDGSRVLAHFPTVDTYNAELSADDVARAMTCDGVADSLVPFGHGDGGGGPTAAMLGRARRMHDLDGVPRAVHTDPDVFVAGLPRAGLPTWRGDLYLETHRGVWTSQRRTKLGDARCDESLRSAETWCATAAVLADLPYPQQELDSLWRRHLLLEFHDILPGSSITRVHREAEAEHAEVLEAALRLRGGAAGRLGGRTVHAAAGPLARPRWVRDAVVLDNGRVRAVVGADGHVRSLVDCATGRETVPPGGSFGALHLHPDDPTVFDAWNLDRSAFDRYDVVGPAGELRIEDDGAVVDRHLPGSSATVRWTLPEDAAALRLSIDVDWHESQRCLKLALPLDLRPPFLSAGVQNGWVPRALHRNTTWEQARYEDWFHGVLHAGEGPTGVAIVTADCHGYDASSRVREDGGTTTDVGLTLLRAPAFPDPTCDQGHHAFQVDVLPACDLPDALRAGRAARAALIPSVVAAAPLATASGHGVSLDAVKLADDGSGDIVLRLHEETGARVEAVLAVAVPVVSSVRCDLLERPVRAAEAVEGRTVRVPLRPFELVTLRLARA